MKEMWRTQWVECHEAFEVFTDLFLATVCCLEEIRNSSPSDSFVVVGYYTEGPVIHNRT